MANYKEFDTKKLTASDSQFSFKNELNKDLERIKNTIMTDGDISILGNNNYVNNAVQKATIAGQSNVIAGNATVTGDSNQVNADVLIIGDRNRVAGSAVKSIIMGSDITATASNTVYCSNLVIPNGGTLNGNALIGQKTYIFRLQYDVTTGAVFSLVYTNDIMARYFTSTFDEVFSDNWGIVNQYEFKITCNDPIFKNRVVVNPMLTRSMLEYTPPESPEAFLLRYTIPLQASSETTDSVSLFFQKNVLAATDEGGASFLPVAHVDVDLEVNVYDPVPTVPELLIYTQSNGDIFGGMTFSLSDGEFTFSQMPDLITFELLPVNIPYVEENILTLMIDDVAFRQDSFPSVEYPIISYDLPMPVGTYKWYLNSNEAFTATYSLTVDSTVFTGSNEAITPPPVESMEIINFIYQNINGVTSYVSMDLTNDILSIIYASSLVEMSINISTLSTDTYTVYIFRDGTAYDQFTWDTYFTYNIVDTMSNGFVGNWSYYISAPAGFTYEANIQIGDGSTFIGFINNHTIVPPPSTPISNWVDFQSTTLPSTYGFNTYLANINVDLIADELTISDNMPSGTIIGTPIGAMSIKWNGPSISYIPGSNIEVYKNGVLFTTLYQTSSNYYNPQYIYDVTGGYFNATWTYFINSDLDYTDGLEVIVELRHYSRGGAATDIGIMSTNP